MLIVNHLNQACTVSNWNDDTFWVKVGKEKLCGLLVDIPNLHENIELLTYRNRDSRVVKTLTHQK